MVRSVIQSNVLTFQGYKPPDEGPSEYQSIPLNKIEDFGVHCKQYVYSSNKVKSICGNKTLKVLEFHTCLEKCLNFSIYMS